MKNVYIIVSLLTLSLNTHEASTTGLVQLTSTHDIVRLFSLTADDIPSRMDNALVDAQQQLQTIINIPSDERTFANTAQELDTLFSLSDLAILSSVLRTLEMVSPDAAIRKSAAAARQKSQSFFIDFLTDNKKLYEAFADYVNNKASLEPLTDEQRYFINKTMSFFASNGVNLPDEQRKQVAQLQKEIAQLTQEFSKNIAEDNRSIAATRDELAGLNAAFIRSLPQQDNGYILGTDYPTYFTVMEECNHEQTRRKLFLAFNNRAYPSNEMVLQSLIEKRHQLAQLLGFESYAHYNLDDAMAQSPERVHHFLDDLFARSQQSMNQYLTILKNNLPEGVSLTPEGKIKPWDVAYAKACYQKKVFHIDEQKIAEYFPMEHTIKELLAIYRQFLGIDFKETPINGLWHEDVKLLEVLDGNDQHTLGYLLLDLFPRPNKYSHACHAGITPSVFDQHNKRPAKLSLVIANFPKATADRPSLLPRKDVKVFFHEFGHALHSILGRTHLGSLAGTNVKLDFVEMPSQMLEEWLHDSDILKKVSCHYKTGESLPDSVIATIQQTRNFDTADWVQRQIFLSKLSLAFFDAQPHKNLHELTEQLRAQWRPAFYAEAEDHIYAAFGHLTGYGAQYYGYLWSKVYALDLFYEIKKYGLLNPAIGKKYVQTVIGKGGSDDPNNLLTNFLGRPANSKAFFDDLGM